MYLYNFISIHALLAESDVDGPVGRFDYFNFYPRSPCGERQPALYQLYDTYAFLSTLSLRRATRHWQMGHSLARHFYPRSPCGERRRVWVYMAGVPAFLSTLSLRRATRQEPATVQRLIFLSTLSLRRATVCTSVRIASNFYFYPRSPCGERQILLPKRSRIMKFLSTLSLRRATVSETLVPRQYQKFLSTLSLRRATIQLEFNSLESKHFYPRSPCGERHTYTYKAILMCKISIHALLAESDQYRKSGKQGTRISIHALLAESDLEPVPDFRLKILISIHALLAESDAVSWVCLAASAYFYPRSPCGERLLIVRGSAKL